MNDYVVNEILLEIMSSYSAPPRWVRDEFDNRPISSMMSAISNGCVQIQLVLDFGSLPLSISGTKPA